MIFLLFLFKTSTQGHLCDLVRLFEYQSGNGDKMQNPKNDNYITWENALFIAECAICKGYTKEEYKKLPSIVKGAIRYIKSKN